MEDVCGIFTVDFLWLKNDVLLFIHKVMSEIFHTQEVNSIGKNQEKHDDDPLEREVKRTL